MLGRVEDFVSSEAKELVAQLGRLESYWGSDQSWIDEWVESGLENCRLCLRLTEEALVKLAEPGLTLEVYNEWLRSRGSARTRDLEKTRVVVARRNRTVKVAIRILEGRS